jgi:hypothetical protein
MVHPLSFARKVLSYGPYAYWMLADAAGSATAIDEVDSPAQDAAPAGGYTFGQPGIGDGHTSIFLDGVNGRVNLLTAALTANFDGSEGTFLILGRTQNLGIWTDGADREYLQVGAGAPNFIYVRKSAANNRVDCYYNAGGVLKFHFIAQPATINWLLLTISWSAAADEFRAYINATEHLPVVGGLGVWGAALAGAHFGSDGGAISFFHGWLQHGAFFNYPLNGAQITDIYNSLP